MADYKLYCLNGAGQIASAPELVTADSDEAAVKAAKALSKTMACELWLGGRLVGRIAATQG